MNKHLSVIALSVTTKIKWILLFWILLPLLSLGFVRMASHALYPDGGSLYMTEMEFWLGFPFCVTFAGLFIALSICCRKSRITSQYTRARLRISERAVIVWDGVVCGASLLVMWQIEIILIYILNWLENGRDFGNGAMQMLKLIERSGVYFRVVFPIENVRRWPVNLLIIAVLACFCALCGYMGEDKYTGKRRRKLPGDEQLGGAENVRD